MYSLFVKLAVRGDWRYEAIFVPINAGRLRKQAFLPMWRPRAAQFSGRRRARSSTSACAGDLRRGRTILATRSASVLVFPEPAAAIISKGGRSGLASVQWPGSSSKCSHKEQSAQNRQSNLEECHIGARLHGIQYTANAPGLTRFLWSEPRPCQPSLDTRGAILVGKAEHQKHNSAQAEQWDANH